MKTTTVDETQGDPEPSSIPFGGRGATGVRMDAEVVEDTPPRSPAKPGAVQTSAIPGTVVPPPVSLAGMELPPGTKLKTVVTVLRSDWWRTTACLAVVAAAVFAWLWLTAAKEAVVVAVDNHPKVLLLQKKMELEETKKELVAVRLRTEQDKAWWARLNKWR